ARSFSQDTHTAATWISSVSRSWFSRLGSSAATSRTSSRRRSHQVTAWLASSMSASAFHTSASSGALAYTHFASGAIGWTVGPVPSGQLLRPHWRSWAPTSRVTWLVTATVARATFRLSAIFWNPSRRTRPTWSGSAWTAA